MSTALPGSGNVSDSTGTLLGTLSLEPNGVETSNTDSPSRRGFLMAAVGAMWAGVVAAAATVVGRAAVAPGLVERESVWIRATRLDNLETNVPTPVTLRIAREDGYLETVDQQVVFLTKSEAGTVHALSSTCAHLGCNVAFDRQKEQFLCPCHEGVFNMDGTVVSGPPPAPLKVLPTRVDNRRVLVQV